MVYLVLCLGNPGPTYNKTRHNVGFMVANSLAKETGRTFQDTVRWSVTCCLPMKNSKEHFIIAKPLTYMNLSGRAARELLEHFKLSVSRLVVVYDDLDLPLGVIRIRRSGSSGGHKGMESIIQTLSTQEIKRLRVGISTGEAPSDYSTYVLEEFNNKQLPLLNKTLDRTSQAIHTILADGLEQAMGLYN